MSKPIYVLCLHNVRTGGPEAIHQLSDALIEQGFDARMVYYDWGQIAALEQAEPDDFYIFGPRANPIEEYARYKTRVEGTVPNQDGYIIVLSETLCHLAPKFPNATVLIWWLSVDNGFGALSRVNLNYLRRPNVYHAWQSEYASRFIEALGIHYHGQLTDYTVDLTEYATALPMAERPKLVAFNTNHKVIADWPGIITEIARLDPTIECVVVKGDRGEVAELFARARLYVDFGCFPGKDRMPREAASLGCDVMVSAGGAAHEMTFAAYRETTENSPAVRAMNIVIAVNCYGGAFAAPNLQAERAKFFHEAATIFRGL